MQELGKNIKKIDYDDIPETIIKAAVKSGLTTRNSSNIKWFTFNNIAIGGLMPFKGITARLVSIYVSPKYRGNGIGTILTEKLIEEAKMEGKTRLTVITNKPIWYKERGWEILFYAKLEGYTWMELNV